jgi:hypothetical protein
VRRAAPDLKAPAPARARQQKRDAIDSSRRTVSRSHDIIPAQTVMYLFFKSGGIEQITRRFAA